MYHFFFSSIKIKTNLDVFPFAVVHHGKEIFLLFVFILLTILNQQELKVNQYNLASYKLICLTFDLSGIFGELSIQMTNNADTPTNNYILYS